MSRELIAGKYRIVRLLGRGGMGEVHEAIHEASQRRVAVKLLTFVQGAGDDDPNRMKEVTARFAREARATGQINSPHVVEILDAGTDDETLQPYIVMEYLTGEDLQRVLRRASPLAVQTALKIAAQAALGLAKAHDQGIVHRDIKPANLFLNKDANGRVGVKVVDFGIARLQQGDENHDLTQDLTRTGSMLGSPTYMAPEQARGLKTIDGRVDVWSLGIVLYKLLTGTTPHERGEGGLGELLIRICVAPAPAVQERAAWVPPEVAVVVHKALKLNPDERYASAQEFYEALRSTIHGPSIELDDSLLVGVSDEDRAFVAAKADISSLSLTQRGNLIPVSEDGVTPDQTRMTMGGDGVPDSWRAPRRNVIGWAAAALTLVALGGVAVWTLAKQSAAASMPTAEPVSPPPAAPTSVEPAVEKPASKKVRLGVPKKARVTVDGEPATVAADGSVELEGPLGSAFTVVVAQGTQSEKRMVAITEAGPVPPMIDLQARPGNTARPGGKNTNTAQPNTAPTGNRNPGLVNDFGN